MASYKVAVIPGDGIGPEVMNEALKVLRVLKDQDSTFQYHADIFYWNSDYYLKHGRMMPEDGLEILKNYDAVLFGAIGDERVPDDITVWELIMPIRKQFQQYINLRPVKKLPGIKTRYDDVKSDIDFVIVRENAEGEYANSGGRLYSGMDQEMAIQNTVITRKGTERAASFAFEYAKKHGKTKVTSATKSNAVVHSMKLWDEAVKAVADSYPEITLEQNYIDALAAYFVMRPESFEVVVASNLFGDILSDLGSALVGGLGISPSANLNPTGEFPSMFEPVHGSAPDIARTGKANPIAQIWSTAMMLEHLGRDDLSTMIIRAIEQVLKRGEVLTADLGGSATTMEMGEAIIEELTVHTSLNK
ncbi:tartrate dehydrogenase/decarboxylase/D-malate dehydrogenase [Evansella vedderi]|uniref:D-malate dehydrogenase (decarboxylating) n=1 Tax=Evansella vedderi TaxID=38282 RepID=A0ABT9ZPW9_9BACI|nr:tartrate dehydrogenase [Evansella vedderi]MDQ0253249.1 tartrate dehydrogenase/decarboxylase/D-malate dehydrogenase [Evansella vedderi]